MRAQSVLIVRLVIFSFRFKFIFEFINHRLHPDIRFNLPNHAKFLSRLFTNDFVEVAMATRSADFSPQGCGLEPGPGSFAETEGRHEFHE